MARWTVHYFKGSKAHYLGVVSASSEKEATQKAAELFHVDPPRLPRPLFFDEPSGSCRADEVGNGTLSIAYWIGDNWFGPLR